MEGIQYTWANGVGRPTSWATASAARSSTSSAPDLSWSPPAVSLLSGVALWLLSCQGPVTQLFLALRVGLRGVRVLRVSACKWWKVWKINFVTIKSRLKMYNQQCLLVLCVMWTTFICQQKSTGWRETFLTALELSWNTDYTCAFLFPTWESDSNTKLIILKVKINWFVHALHSRIFL